MPASEGNGLFLGHGGKKNHGADEAGDGYDSRCNIQCFLEKVAAAGGIGIFWLMDAEIAPARMFDRWFHGNPSLLLCMHSIRRVWYNKTGTIGWRESPDAPIINFS